MKKAGIIGLGKAGTVMAYLLAEKGYRVKVVLSKPLPQANVKIKDRQFAILNLEQLVQEVNILLITTPDRIIAEIVQKLIKLELRNVNAVLHLSGNHPVEILKPLQEKEVSIGSLHPLQSLAELDQSLINLPGSIFTFEGDAELLPWVASLVKDLNCQLFVAPVSFNKTLYHAGASIASNFLVTLAKMGTECLTKAGLSPVEAQKALIPLMQGTLNNLLQSAPEKALTGPIVRGDTVTISSHLRELKRLPHLLPAYQALGTLTAALALQAGSPEPIDYRDMLEIIKNGGPKDDKSDSSNPEGKKDSPRENHHDNCL